MNTMDAGSSKPNTDTPAKDIDREIHDRNSKALEYQRRREETRVRLLAEAKQAREAQQKPDTPPGGATSMTQSTTVHAHGAKTPRNRSAARAKANHAVPTKGRGNKDKGNDSLYLGIRNIRRATWEKIQAFVESRKGTEAKTNAGTVISDAVDQWLAAAKDAPKAKRGPGRSKKTE